MRGEAGRDGFPGRPGYAGLPGLKGFEGNIGPVVSKLKTNHIPILNCVASIKSICFQGYPGERGDQGPPGDDANLIPVRCLYQCLLLNFSVNHTNNFNRLATARIWTKRS